MDSIKTHSQNIRVLMIGPGKGIIGGISTLVETLLPVLEQRVSLRYLPSVERRELKDSGKITVRNLVIAVSLYARFLAAIIRFRPQIIHLHTSQGIAWLKDSVIVILGKLFFARMVIHIHGGNFDTIYNGYPRVMQWYTRRILGLADAIIVVSSEWKNRLAKLISIDRIFSFINCIDTLFFQPARACNDDEVVNILFLGRVGPLKGTNDLIVAIHCIKPGNLAIHAWIAGPEERDGDLQSAQHLLEEYQLTDTCEILGPVQRERVMQLFREASVFVLPSRYEGLPMVVLEALASGLPVVATRVGGIPEVIQDNDNGFLVQPADIEALAGALEKLAGNPNLRRKMGQRSREIAERDLNVWSYAEKVTSLYTSLAH